MFHRKSRRANTGSPVSVASNRRDSSASSKSLFSLSKTFSKTTISADNGAGNSKGPLGLNLLHSPPEPQIDFIFVHGLGGCSRKTWCKDSQYWPQEWLPKEPAFKNVRIHSYGYDTDYLKGKEDCLNIHHIGKSFLGEISTSPYLVDSRTHIVAIGHSMGGLVIKKAYILARQDATYKSLADRFAAVYFLATPHRGADSAKMLKNILKVAYDRTYVADLGRNSGAVQVINDEFRHFSANVELRSFYETQTMKYFSSPIVDPESAILGYREEKQMPMNADHRSICKFESQSDPNYIIMRNALASTVGQISKAIPELELKEQRNLMRDMQKYLGVSEIFDDDLLMVREARMQDSCQWISSKDSYVKWRDGEAKENKILWINGKPATGKSVLAGYVFDNLTDGGHACSHFFFKHGDKQKSGLGACLRSLAFQMASSNVEARDTMLAIQKDGFRVEQADERTLWRILFISGIFKAAKARHFWVIDALDECSNFAVLFDSILANIDESIPLRILITSRHTVDLDQKFIGLQSKWLQSLSISTMDTISDLKLLIKSKADALTVVGNEGRAILGNKILSKSEGSFLWTILVLKELLSCHSKKEIDRILEEVPRDMEPLYKRTLDLMSLAVRGKELAFAVLLWASCAVRPMTTSELHGALNLDIEDAFPKLEESIAELCGQLVVVDKFRRLQMVHETAREFLLSDGLKSEFAIKKREAHTRIAIVCLRYLVGEEMKPPRSSQRRFSASAPKRRADFAIYAYTAYSFHLSKAEPGRGELFQLVERFLKSNVLTWIEAIANSQDLSQLIRTSKHLSTYLNACSVERSPLDPRVRALRQWTADLARIAAKFANALITSPSAIYSLIPPLCPTGSMIYETSSQGRKLSVLGSLSEQWDDRLSCIDFRQSQLSTLSYGDEFLGIGLATGVVALYYATSYQEYKVLDHGESVKFIRFKSKTDLIATCGMRMTKVWDIRSGEVVHSFDSPQGPLDMTFDDNMLLVASHKNYLQSWDLEKDGLPQPERPWCDSAGQSSTPPRQPPYALTISITHGMLAVAYSGQPITIWDLKEDDYCCSCGKRTASGETSTHRVVALAFNPNPNIELLAVAYLDGDLALLDPFNNRQLECFRANCQSLAASPNGRFLAAGAANGTIHVYEFDTFKPLYRVKASNSYIKQLGFTKDSLRLADIRGGQCSVWEPPALLRDALMSDDTTSATLESIVDTVSIEAKAKITSMVVHPATDVIFCGKDDGAVLLYSRKTAACLGTLYSHKSPVRLLTWCQQRDGLLSVDASNRIFFYEIKKSAEQSWLAGITVLFRSHLESEKAIVDVLAEEAAGKFVVSTRESDHMFTLDGAHERDLTYAGVPAIRKWISHPNSSLLLICIDNVEARIYRWTDWSQVGAFSLFADTEMIQLKSSVFFSFGQEQRLLLEFSERDGSTKTNDLLMFDASCFDIGNSGGGGSSGQGKYSSMATTGSQVAVGKRKEGEEVSSHLAALFGYQTTSFAQNVAHIIGIRASRKLVFLDRSSWVCSCDLGDSGLEVGLVDPSCTIEYFRHFFVPYEWFAGRRDVVCAVTPSEVMFAGSGDLTVVRGCFDHAEKVSSE
ncbi:hypothetical protein QQZ08_004142 [Neonectria magnoliae]|uniref:GPI inositol-deacylase n=1 Tax=Neonectria magnoliae TaxID=2732573 RepID=A0ABR1I706_9HYPO